MTLYYNYENNPFKAYEYALLLTNEFPDNPTFQRWKGRVLAKKGDNLLAAAEFQNVLDKGKMKFAGYNTPKVKREADYYVGLQHYNMSNFDSAKYYFTQCENISKEIDTEEESGFLINSVLYLGMIYDSLGLRDEAIKYYEELLEMREYGNSHALARLYLDKPFKK